jgi:hypothetical protein
MSPAQVTAVAGFSFGSNRAVRITTRSMTPAARSSRTSDQQSAGPRTHRNQLPGIPVAPYGGSLHVENLAVQEGHLQIFIHINLLRTEVHDLLRFAHRCLDLVRSHALLDALRFSLLL